MASGPISTVAVSVRPSQFPSDRHLFRGGPEGEEPSGIGHCYDKLLNLNEEMHTEASRELARERHEFLREFVERFDPEWRGEA